MHTTTASSPYGSPSRFPPRVVVVTPYLGDANNGNWQTARRWARHLARSCRVRVVQAWPDVHAARDQVMIALHARRSAASIQAWSAAHPGRSLAVVLTGTDLYRDIQIDASAQHSLALAQCLVTLQALGPERLPVEVRDKTRVIHQSTTIRTALVKSHRFLRGVMVGHLRPEKSPETLMAAASLLAHRPDIHLDLVGNELDPALGRAARNAGQVNARFRWLGGLAHESVRRRIQRAHVLVHPSRMEGGAHVVMEAVCSGTPVLASRVDGNVGMLGEDYDGYFPWGDARALAALLMRCRAEPDFLVHLMRQCEARAPLFDPARERAELARLVADLITEADS